jgi:two-component system, OmpR family, sensor kinase
MLRTLSIRWKMALAYSVLLAALLAGFGLAVYFGVLTQTEAQATELARTRAREIADLVGTNTDIPLQRVVDGFAGPGVYVQLRAADGQVLAGSSNLGGQPLPAAAPMAAQAAFVARPSAADEPERLLVWHEPLPDASPPATLVEVAVSLAAGDAVLDRIIDWLTGAAVAAILFALLGAWWLAGQVLGPIDQVTATAARIGAAGLSERIGYRGPDDEVGRLARTFDAMLARLDASFRIQRRFVADASHELRTPLQALLGHARLLARRGEGDAALRAETTSAILAQAERMQRLIEGLLALARADDAPPLPRTVVHLDELVAHVVDEFADQAQAQRLQLLVGSADSLTVLGDAERLRLLVRNLIDNALKFTPPVGHVTVMVQRDGSSAVLIVEDTGPGIPPEALPHVFERFYQADLARHTGGAGLGLAIAYEAAQAHGGTLTAANRLAGGARFEARLPMALSEGGS